MHVLALPQPFRRLLRRDVPLRLGEQLKPDEELLDRCTAQQWGVEANVELRRPGPGIQRASRLCRSLVDTHGVAKGAIKSGQMIQMTLV